MALSTMNIDKVQSPAAYWKFELSNDSFRRSPNINYICVPTTAEFKTKIVSLLETILFLPCDSVLVQYWAAREIGNTVVLTTTCQPFGLWGNNRELQLYQKGCSDHKLYVHPKEGVAFGLSGRVFLNRTHEHTQNVHRYPKYQRPPCEDAIFTKIWGSFVVPVIDADKCVGVLEFVMDRPKDSYDIYIGAVYGALEHAGFQSRDPNTNCVRNTDMEDPRRLRRTKSFEITKYCCLVPYFGLSSAHAADMLRVKMGTFRNACRNVGISEWPYIPKSTTAITSFDLETQINPTIYGASYFATSIATPCIWNMGIYEWSPQAPFSGLVTNQIDCDDTSPFGTLIATEYMASDYGSLGAPISTDQMLDLSYLIPGWNVGSCESPYAQVMTTSEASLTENRINQITYEPSSSVTSIATEDVEMHESSSIMTTGASPPETLIDQTSGTACTEPWNIEFERERADFMQEFDLDRDTCGFFYF
ncbi:hypothetical protein M8C21_001175 [Ambrosia artemisiifolia]|uniref:RWP-RK domain-containing protein n=1 Tax=Ambrosia artemisiifolia TaxID=4212 RepID=A0AAD5D825_AMBAR|nr:hypothetical protein M8C21_001175 [Ambrosia artemisiifolia]